LSGVYLADRKALSDIIERQAEAIELLEDASDLETFKEARKKIDEASLGFLSEDTRRLLYYAYKWELYRMEEYKLLLIECLREDFDNAKRVLLTHSLEKPYDKYPQSKEVTTLKQPTNIFDELGFNVKEKVKNAKK